MYNRRPIATYLLDFGIHASSSMGRDSRSWEARRQSLGGPSTVLLSSFEKTHWNLTPALYPCCTITSFKGLDM